MICLIAPKLDVGLFSEVCFRYKTHIHFFCVKDCLQFLLMLQKAIGIPCHNFESAIHFCFVLGVAPWALYFNFLMCSSNVVKSASCLFSLSNMSCNVCLTFSFPPLVRMSFPCFPFVVYYFGSSPQQHYLPALGLQLTVIETCSFCFHILGFNFLQFYGYTTLSIVSRMRFSAMHTFRLGFFWLPALFGNVLPCTLVAPWVFVTVPLCVPVCLALLTLWHKLRFSKGLNFYHTTQNASDLIYLICVFISTERQDKHIKRLFTSPFKFIRNICYFISSCFEVADYSARVA